MNWSRREFMVASAVGVVAQPLLTQLSNVVPEVKAEEVPKPAGGYDNPKCKGCRACTILYSNCMALNNRVCWCEASGKETA